MSIAWPEIWQGLAYPLLRLLAFMSAGLLLAIFLEAMHWTRWMSKLAAPLTRLGHMGEIASASFAMAFFSPASSNALLSESYQRGEISRREVVFANLFNSSPSFLVHLPTLAALVLSFLGAPGLIYIGLSFAAACLRTLATALCGRLLLPPPAAPTSDAGPRAKQNGKPNKSLAARVLARFKKRIVKIVLFTVPVYVLVFIIQKLGGFDLARSFLAGHTTFFSFLRPEALGIVALALTAELSAALSASAALAGALPHREIILALLVGNILSTPIRAFRHQLPSYAGFYSPALALRLVACNQALRAASMILVTFVYFLVG